AIRRVLPHISQTSTLSRPELAAQRLHFGQHPLNPWAMSRTRAHLNAPLGPWVGAKFAANISRTCKGLAQAGGRSHGGRIRRDERRRRDAAPGLWRAFALARGGAAGCVGLSQARGRTPVPPYRHHLCDPWRGRGAG